MKKILFVLLTAVLLVGCGSDTQPIEEENEEMTKEVALEYLEQMTYRLVEAQEQEDGSFEQRSSLQAALNRVESIVEELRENHEDNPIVEQLEIVASHARLGAEKGLDESYLMIEIHLDLIVEEIQGITELDGEFPETLKSKYLNK